MSTNTNQNPVAKIYGVIGSEKGTTAKAFQALLEAATTDETECIDVHIHSAGGRISEGNNMINLMKQSSKPITTYNDGVAYSMGAFIFLSAPNRLMASNALLMIHAGSTNAQGTSNDLREEAEILDKYNHTLAVTLSEATGKTIEEVTALWLDGKDHYFTAQEAVDAGLATDITDYSAQVTLPENITALSLNEVVAILFDPKPEAALSESDNYYTDWLISDMRNLLSNAENLQESTDPALVELANTIVKTNAAFIRDLVNIRYSEENVSTVMAMIETVGSDPKAAVKLTAITAKLNLETVSRQSAEAKLAEATAEITTLQTKVEELGAAHPGVGAQAISTEGKDNIETEASTEEVVMNIAHNARAKANPFFN